MSVCDTLLQYPAKTPCGTKENGVCTIRLYKEVEYAFCSCVNPSFTGLGDFTPNTIGYHCDLHKEAIAALWWIALLAHSVLILLSVWKMMGFGKMVKIPNYFTFGKPTKPTSNNNNNNNNNNNTKRSLPPPVPPPHLSSGKHYTFSSINGSSAEFEPTTLDIHNPQTPATTTNNNNNNNSNNNDYEERTIFEQNLDEAQKKTVITNKPRTNNKRRRSSIIMQTVSNSTFIYFLCICATASSIILCLIKATDGVGSSSSSSFGIGRDYLSSSLFGFSVSLFMIEISIFFYRRTKEAYKIAKIPKNPKEFQDAKFSRKMTNLLLPVIAVASVVVSFLPIVLVSDEQKTDYGLEAQVVLIIMVVTYQLLIFLGVLSYAQAVWPLKERTPEDAASGGVLRTLSRNGREVIRQIGRRLSRSASKSPSGRDARNLSSSQDSRDFGERSNNNHFVPPLPPSSSSSENMGSRRDSTESQNEHGKARNHVPISAYISYSLWFILYSFPILGFVCWPYFAARFSYLMPLLWIAMAILWKNLLELLDATPKLGSEDLHALSNPLLKRKSSWEDFFQSLQKL